MEYAHTQNQKEKIPILLSPKIYHGIVQSSRLCFYCHICHYCSIKTYTYPLIFSNTVSRFHAIFFLWTPVVTMSFWVVLHAFTGRTYFCRPQEYILLSPSSIFIFYPQDFIIRTSLCHLQFDSSTPTLIFFTIWHQKLFFFFFSPTKEKFFTENIIISPSTFPNINSSHSDVFHFVTIVIIVKKIVVISLFILLIITVLYCSSILQFIRKYARVHAHLLL